ncbi:hypothetical protein BT96DRAFT_924337, partial [Gymnopus androsaceus JB14]
MLANCAADGLNLPLISLFPIPDVPAPLGICSAARVRSSATGTEIGVLSPRVGGN